MSGQEEFLTPEEVPIYTLDVKPSWDKLTEKEKLYAHYFSLASWAGQTIVFKQVSLESIDIFNLLQALFRGVRVADLKSKALAQGSVSEKEFGDFLQYVANFYGSGLCFLQIYYIFVWFCGPRSSPAFFSL
jgi:dipeptidyl-peptidase-3